jgi:hypothetical protein
MPPTVSSRWTMKGAGRLRTRDCTLAGQGAERCTKDTTRRCRNRAGARLSQPQHPRKRRGAGNFRKGGLRSGWVGRKGTQRTQRGDAATEPERGCLSRSTRGSAEGLGIFAKADCALVGWGGKVRRGLSAAMPQPSRSAAVSAAAPAEAQSGWEFAPRRRVARSLLGRATPLSLLPSPRSCSAETRYCCRSS